MHLKCPTRVRTSPRYSRSIIVSFFSVRYTYYYKRFKASADAIKFTQKLGEKLESTYRPHIKGGSKLAASFGWIYH